MAYCGYCGNELAPGEECGCKQATANKQNTTNDIAETQPKSQSSWLRSVVSIFKHGLSLNTVSGVVAAAGKPGFAWLFFLLLYTAISGLNWVFLIPNSMQTLAKSMQSTSTTILQQIGLPFAYRLGVGTLLGFVQFTLVLFLVMLALAVAGKKIRFCNIGNMVAAAFVPTCVLMLLALIASFFYPLASSVLLLCAFTSTILLLYFGLQRLDTFSRSPFWLFIVLFAVFCVLVGIILFKGLMPNILQNFANLLLHTPA